jgi:XTP/dITP diphosphohydrolase
MMCGLPTVVPPRRSPAGESLLLATTNLGKIREIREVLDGLPFRLLTLSDLSSRIPEPEETGQTFAENALLKARAYAEASGLPTVAEDSGLAIDAINGRPGVESARYPGRDYAEKFANLYRELAGRPRPWTARFVCSLAYVGRPSPSAPIELLFATEATVEGEITDTPRGENGFGYDPIFFYPPYGSTLAEADTDRKLAVAHRGKAFRTFRAWLEALGRGT